MSRTLAQKKAANLANVNEQQGAAPAAPAADDMDMEVTPGAQRATVRARLQGFTRSRRRLLGGWRRGAQMEEEKAEDEGAAAQAEEPAAALPSIDLTNIKIRKDYVPKGPGLPSSKPATTIWAPVGH